MNINCFCQSPTVEKSNQKQKDRTNHSTSTRNGTDGDTGCSGAISTADWMQDLVQTNPTIRLKDLIIPGSNDSASYSVQYQPFALTSQTQNLSLRQQLEAGVRYLDIRVGPSGHSYLPRSPSGISVWSGFLEGSTLESILEDIKEFCDAHTECIIMEITPVSGGEFYPDQKFTCLDTIITFFGGEEKRSTGKYKYIIPGKKVTDTILNKPLAEVLKLKSNNNLADPRYQQRIQPENWIITRPKDEITNSKLILLANDRFLEDDFEEDDIDYKFFSLSSKYLCSPRNQTNDVKILLPKNLENLHRFEQFKYLICTKFIVSPGVSSTMDVFNAIRGKGNSLRPLSIAMNLYDNYTIDNYLMEHNAEKWGICTLDYIDLCPDLIDLMIGFNFAISPIPTSNAVTAKSSESVAAVSTRTKDTDDKNKTEETTNKGQKPATKLHFALVESTNESKCPIPYRKVMATDNLINDNFVCRNYLLYFKDIIRDLDIPEEYQSNSNHFRLTVGYSIRSGKSNKKAYHVVTTQFPGDYSYPIIVAPYFCTMDGSDVVTLDVLESKSNVEVQGNSKSKTSVSSGGGARKTSNKSSMDLITLATVVNFFLCNKKNMHKKKITFLLN